MEARSGRVRIVTDTTSVIPMEFASTHDVEVVPQVILFGEESFLEEVELPYADFIRRLKSSPALPKTAAPPPGEFVKAYGRQLAKGRSVLSIHPSVEISGTVRSAITAQEESFVGADIRILDTRTVAADLASMVMLATGWAEEGRDADEIMSRLREMIPRSRSYFVVPTLEYLQKGGRIGGAAALIGSALQVKPILELKDGRIEVLERVRTQRRAYERLIELVARDCPRSPDAHLSVMHADDLASAERLRQDLRDALGVQDIPVYPLGASITAHGGPGILAVGFFTQG